MPLLLQKKYFIIALSLLITGILGYLILPVSIPLICAFLTACLLEPAAKALQKKYSWSRKLANLIVCTLFFMLIGISAYFLTTKVITEAVQLIQKLPSYINQINDSWLNYDRNLNPASAAMPEPLMDEIRTQTAKTLDRVKAELGTVLNIDKVTGLITNIPNLLISFIVYLVALFLFLNELPSFRRKIYSYLKNSSADKFQLMSSRLSYVLSGFIKAQFLVGIIIFTVTLIGMLFINAGVAMLMAVLITIIDFIPFIGSMIILGPWALFHFMTGDIPTGTQLAVLGCMLLIIRRTVEPKVTGVHIGLSPLNTLVSMYLGFKLFGILGIIFGPVLLAAFYTASETGIIKLPFKI
ncbi:sporulation integral membrane protein YtvI [Peribacillus deserti]|uniref:sporulation integral membrane protein YtvI n=1 Tax=Peribacillus deserti TaxID=673318 RepID=UPI002152E1A0|nr:sporulation integral membrane protein YtvI [Peribacillus deserti]